MKKVALYSRSVRPRSARVPARPAAAPVPAGATGAAPDPAASAAPARRPRWRAFLARH
jgi:hypothetical protein